MFKYMPLLKNATSRNLVPLYDYEQLSTYAGGVNSQNILINKDRNFAVASEPPLFFMMMNLYDIVPRINAESNPLVTAIRIPANTNEDVTFHRLSKGPEGNYIMEAKELRKFIQNGQLGRAASSSFMTNKLGKNAPDLLSANKIMDLDESDVDLQADEYQNFLGNEIDFEDKEWNKKDEEKILEMYQKRTFTKHGWDFIVVSKKQQVQMGTTHGPFNMHQLVNQNENKRATNLYSARETFLKNNLNASIVQGGATQNEKDLSFKVPAEPLSAVPEHPTPKGKSVGAPLNDATPPVKINVVPIEEYNAIADQTIEYSMHNQPNQYLQTNRLGLFFRQEGRGAGTIEGIYDNPNDPSNPQNASNKVYGNALIAAGECKKEFKLQLSICNHTYSANIESMYSASLESVVQVLEQSDKFQNQQSYKELLHRKGLNMRFSWLVLPKLRQNPQRELVMMDILIRVMRKIINEEVKQKSVAKSKAPPSDQHGGGLIEEYYQGGGSVDTYKEMLMFYMNTLLKRKILKYKQVFEETLLGLFLHRMSILNMVHAITMKREEYFYLESKDILEDIIDVPAKNPSLFINAVQSYFKIEFKSDFLRTLRQDRYVFIAKSQPISKSDIKPMTCRCNLESPFTLREEAYFILAFNISKSIQQKGGGHNLGASANNTGKQKGNLGGGGGGQKVKTKTDKEKMQVSGPQKSRQLPNSMPECLMASARESARQVGPLGSNSMIHSNNTSVLIESQEVLNQSKESIMNIYSKNVNTLAADHPQISSLYQEQSQTNRNKEPVLHDFRQPKDSLSTIRQYQNMEAIINESPMFAQNIKNGEETIKMPAGQMSNILDFSKYSKRNNFKPSSPSEIILPSSLYKLKTYFSNNPMYYFDDATKTIVGSSETSVVLQSYYELPSVDVIENWTIVMESLVKDVYTVNGSEQVLLEALVYQALLIYFYKNGESDELFKVLAKIREALFSVTFCSPETLILIQILTGMYFEEKRDQLPIEAEKSYLTAMVCIFQMHGDPKGRGNYTIPYSLFLSWKLSLISLAEDKKLHDSEFAEELFDASLRCLWNHKLHYREQQLTHFNQMGGKPNSNTANSSLPTEIAAALGNAQVSPLEKSKFEMQVEKQERERNMFELKKYKAKGFNLTYASGIHKSIARLFGKKSQQQAAMNVYVSVNHHYNNNKELKGSGFKNVHSSTDMFLMSQEIFKSRSQVPLAQRRKNQGVGGAGTVIFGEGTIHGEDGVITNQNMIDLDPSEIDFEIEDEVKNFFTDENFGRNNEASIGICPFQHWSIYRQHIMQILSQRNFNRGGAATAQSSNQRDLYRDMVIRFLQKDLFYQWLIRFNPIMYQSGAQWSNQTIREFIFCQNQQMVNSSSSSVVMSNHNMSHHSVSNRSSGLSLGTGSSMPTSAKEKKNIHLGSYSQILGKEVGGISKQDMHGILYTMGTDAYGQLGQEAITSQARETHSISLKVLYPRMIVSLRDELIKEICCGHGHSFAINVHGQVFAWGLNENGQLGLGPDAPANVRKPVLNPYLQNVNKISTGNEHSLAVNKTGELFVWGGLALTGLNDLNVRPTPTKLEFFANLNLKIHQAICGGLHTVVLTKEGEIYSWGSTEGGQLGLPLQLITAVTQGREEPVLTPQKIQSLEGIHITQVACGEAHTIAIAKDGRVFGWGMSNYGQLGLGFSSDSFEPGIGMEKSKVLEPVEITHLKGQNRIIKIYCGGTFSLFQTDKGDLFGCGMNDLGQLGLDTYMEELLQLGGVAYGAPLDKVKRGKHQQTSTDVTVPTKIICFQGIPLHNLACGENHALAISGDDKNMLWAWGMYRQGQLGLGEVTMKMNPRPVQTLCSSSIQRIACGSMHSLVLIGDTQQISSNYYNSPSTFETLQNHWQSDLKGLGTRIVSGGGPADKESDEQFHLQQLHQFWSSNQPHNFPIYEVEGEVFGTQNIPKRANEVAEQEGEGMVKNPK